MSKPSLQFLTRLLYQFKEYYPVIFIYAVFTSILTLATPISIQSLVNTLTFGPYFQPIFILTLVLLGLLLVVGLLKSLQYIVVEYLQRKLFARMMSAMSYAYGIEAEAGVESLKEKSNRFFDIILIHKNLAFLVTDGIAIFFQVSIGLVLIALYNPLFIVFGALILLAIFIPFFFLANKGLQSALNESSSKYKIASFIDHLSTEQPRQTADKNIITNINKNLGDFLEKRASHFNVLFYHNVWYVVSYASLNALLLALGGYLVISNELSVGQLVAAEIVVNAILIHFLYAKKYLESFYDMYAASMKLEPFFTYLDKVQEKKYNEFDGHLENGMDIFGYLEKGIRELSIIYKPRNYKAIIAKFVLSVIVFFAVLLVVPWQQFSRGEGTVVAFNPNNRVQSITAPVKGIVEKWLVQDGQMVKKGDPIVRVVDNDPLYLERLEEKRNAALKKFYAAKDASDIAKINFKRQEKLVKEGLSSSKDFEKAQINYKKLLSEEATAANSLAKAEVDLSRQQQQVVVAPRDGQILRIMGGSGSMNIKEGEPLVQFVPESDDDVVEIFIDANDLPLVYPGRKVRLQFEGWPAIQFTGWPSVAIGSFGGIVSVIDPFVGEGGRFRVLVKPDPADPEPWPDKSILRQGTRVIGVVNLNVVRLGYELWRQVNGFPKSMKMIPPSSGSADKTEDKK